MSERIVIEEGIQQQRIGQSLKRKGGKLHI